MRIQGASISPGLAQGPAFVLDGGKLLEDALSCSIALSAHDEIERFRAARTRAVAQLETVQRQLATRGTSSDAAIFSTHADLMSDPMLSGRIEEKIRDQRLSAEAAVAHVVLDLENQFRKSTSSLLQDKAADILDVGYRLVRCLRGIAEFESVENGVIVAVALTPSELVRAVHQGAVAAVVESCGQKSHTAILARGLGIPMTTGIADAIQNIPNGSQLIVNGDDGSVIVQPDEKEIAACEMLLQRSPLETPSEHAVGEATTLDGVRIHVLLNISDPLEAEAAAQLDTDGVGLYRTEFLYLDRLDWPSEQDSYEEYSRAAAALGDRELNIRLADFGAEKCPPYADIPINRNPSLGIRGVRLLLSRDDIMRPQVRALCRLAQDHDFTVLLPMVDTLDMLLAVIDRLCRHAACRQREDLPFRLGLMVEVPAAGYAIDDLLDHVDSVSIGLNDLTQYFLAADRDDELVESYHDPLQPAVLRLLKQVLETAAARGMRTTMCGELAGEPMLGRVLAGLGARRFSVSRSHYQRTVSQFRRLDIAQEQALSQKLLTAGSGREVRRLLAAAVKGEPKGAA